jgi:hypothetical protein
VEEHCLVIFNSSDGSYRITFCFSVFMSIWYYLLYLLAETYVGNLYLAKYLVINYIPPLQAISTDGFCRISKEVL